jgi:hypothetical protein
MRLGGRGWVILVVFLCAGVPLGFIPGRFLRGVSDGGGFITRTMNQGGAPKGKRASTMKRERMHAEVDDPEMKKTRLDGEAFTKKHFFDTRPPSVSAVSAQPGPSATVATLTVPAAHQEECQASIPPLPAKELREQKVQYLDPVSGRVVQWNASSKCLVCTCDSTPQCGGNRRLDRCKGGGSF